MFRKAREKSSQEEMWGHFSGKRNSQELLDEKAQILAFVVMGAASEDSKNLIQEITDGHGGVGEKESNFFFPVMLEMAVFMLHYTDRIAFAMLPLNARDRFMEIMLSKLTEAYVDSLGKELGEKTVKEGFENLYNVRQLEYSKYEKLVPDENEGTGGTLIWEASKNLCAVFEEKEDAFAIMTASVFISTALTSLAVPKLLEG